MRYYKNYTGESLAKFYKQNEKGVVTAECGGRAEMVQGVVKLGASAAISAAIMEDSPGIMLPLGRGHPRVIPY
ncbi:hypothetical protein [Desulfotruncus alcoholivorax]|uniref:hypothetical protein n=1 Tax=Desulfotruncus alcoholivorax TaxID=265477 RepID=UPI0004099292|nr:hypothetical protein [Desulfotruncus alcoholivorax]